MEFTIRSLQYGDNCMELTIWRQQYGIYNIEFTI